MSSQPINTGARPTASATEDTAPAEVRGIFDAIAPTYDLLNHLLSFSLDRLWWHSTARAFAPILARPDAKIADLCCGTGDQTAALLAKRPANSEPGVEPIVGLDFSPQMLDRARVKYTDPRLIWVEGDAMHLPFADSSLDLITSAFGFRNLPNYAAALVEFHRVLKPGGQIGILECNQPDGLSGLIYNGYLHYGLPLLGGLISGQREAYKYLPASIARFPRPQQMHALIKDAGFTSSTWKGYFLDAAGLYIATK